MTDSQPPRHSLFAVWHWPRRMWGVAAALLIVGYVVSPPIMAQVLVRTSPGPHLFVPVSFEIVTSPLNWVAGKFAVVQEFYQGENDLIDRLLGPSRYRIVWAKGAIIFLAASPVIDP